MSDPQALLTLAHWLAGVFENQSQAQSQPVWFVHLQLWHRPLPVRIKGDLAFFAEQSNVLYLDNPYRQRVMVLQANGARVQYFAFKQPDQFRGAGANPSLLSTLSLDDLELLPGCVLHIAQQQDCFRGEPQPDAICCFQYDGKMRHVILGFEASQKQFLSFDRGVDPETGQALWGALMGAYEYDKREDLAADLPL